jgi:plastocyanin
LALPSFGGGCGKSDAPAPAAAASQPAPKAPEPAPVVRRAPTGTITGKIAFAGAPPEMPELPRFAESGKPRDPACATHEKAGYVSVENGGLKDVVVRLPVGSVSVTDRGPMQFPPVTIDQKNCIYSPHVVALAAGQKLAFKNSDDTLHNVHTYVGEEPDYNNAFPSGTPARETDVGAPPGDVEYKVKCDVHPWMEAHVLVSDHPFFTVTGADGSFKLEAPAGTYDLEAWHPHLGIKHLRVTVEAGKTVTATFPEFTAADYKAP